MSVEHIQAIIDDIEDVSKQVKRINRFLLITPDISDLDTKDLNAMFSVDGYVFSKLQGKQRLIKKRYVPNSRSRYNEVSDEIVKMQHQVELMTTKFDKIEELVKQMYKLDENLKEVDCKANDCLKYLTERVAPLVDANTQQYNTPVRRSVLPFSDN